MASRCCSAGVIARSNREETHINKAAVSRSPVSAGALFVQWAQFVPDAAGTTGELRHPEHRLVVVA
jgi:hypothetical protein